MKEDFAAIRNRRDLIKAKNLASWAAIGLLLPIVGIIIAIMAHQKLNYVVETEENFDEISRVRSSANLWVLGSILAGILWATLYILASSTDDGVLF